jgi:hypothetical protein
VRGPSLVLIAVLPSACAAGVGNSDAPPSNALSDASLIPVPTHAPRRTEGSPLSCPEALIEGELVANDEWGIALEERLTGDIVKIVWPFGFAARQDGDRLALLNESGEVVAHVGDQVRMGGGQVGGSDMHTWWNCQGQVTVLEPG